MFNEEVFFNDYLIDSSVVVAGFSYGAIEAVEYALESSERIDRLILLSPAYFQNKKPSFARMQLRYFDSNKEKYIENFLANVAHPQKMNLAPYLSVGSKDQLEKLLTYKWESKKLQTLLDRGITIEVFLGGEDKIMDTNDAFDFFSSCVTTYFFKKAGHLLSITS